MRSKAFANVRSLGREGGRGEGGASPPNGPGAAEIRGGASLTASDALSASLLFRWVARLPKVRCEKSAERESAEGRERERERESWKERERGGRERGVEKAEARHFSFRSLLTTSNPPPSPLLATTDTEQDQLSALLDGHFTSKKKKNNNNNNNKNTK